MPFYYINKHDTNCILEVQQAIQHKTVSCFLENKCYEIRMSGLEQAAKRIGKALFDQTLKVLEIFWEETQKNVSQ